MTKLRFASVLIIVALSASSGFAEPAGADKRPIVVPAQRPTLQLKTETDLKFRESDSIPTGLTPLREPILPFLGLNLTQPLRPTK
jgi:hypothetical protein